MPSPFPGMDPYLEHPSLWPDIHNSLIAAIRDELSPQVAPRYYVGLERRAYLFKPDDIVFVGRPDVSIVQPRRQVAAPEMALAIADGPAVYEVDLPMGEEVSESPSQKSPFPCNRAKTSRPSPSTTFCTASTTGRASTCAWTTTAAGSAAH